jgi:uncharacterized membrane protein YkoI
LAFVIFGAVLPLQPEAHAQPGIMVAQGGGKSLSQAIEQVRRQTGGKILSAETRVQGGREVHHIKVLINDKQVRTVKVNGRKVDR